MDFALFLVLNAVLFLRPEELVPSLAEMRVYYVTICACILATLPRLLTRLTPGELRERPVVVCVLVVWVAAFLSLAARGQLEAGYEVASEFGKVILYFLLAVAVLDTPERFRAFAGWVVVYVLVMAALAVGTYHGMLDLEAFEPILQGEINRETGEYYLLPRLVGSGVFADPNDMCLALVFAGLCCVYRATTAEGFTGRLLWLAPVGCLFYALTLTHSRGGMLGLLAAVGGWLYARFGNVRGLPLAAAAVAGLLAAVGGRGANISGGGTAHERLMLWAYGLNDLFSRPLYLPVGLGVGYYQEEYAYVAHNSFMSGYVETGILGGGALLIAFLTAARQAYRVGRDGPAEDWALAARPFVFAAVIGYAGGAFSLSRGFVIPTYLVLGLATAYAWLAVPVTPDRFRVSGGSVRRAAMVAIGGLLFLKLFTQLAGTLGV